MENPHLRKTSWFQEKIIAGLVQSNMPNKSSKFEILLPVEGVKFSFKYDHVLLAKRL
jgi:hypothetical protein